VKRTYIQLTAFWGNDDAESSIRISRRRWNAIQSGAEYEVNAASWYGAGGILSSGDSHRARCGSMVSTGWSASWISRSWT
jgi:hypothetical protein